MYSPKSTIALLKEKQVNDEPKSEYDKGIEFIDVVVTNFSSDVAKILTDTTGQDLMFAPVERLKREVYYAIKNQNPKFIEKFSELVVKKENQNKKSDALNTKIRPLETRFSAAGDRVFDEKYTKAKAIDFLVKQKQYTPEMAEVVIDTEGANSDALDDFFKTTQTTTGKKPFDWNLALDTTGKVAQTVFYLGSIFSKKDDPTPTPTVSDSDIKMNETKSNTTRNVVITLVIVTVLVIVAVVVIKSSKSKKTAEPTQ